MKGPQLTGILFGLFLLSSVFLYVTGYGAHLAGMAFFNYQEPDGVFDPEQAVDAPDYNNVAFWAALPTTVDPADLVPAGIAAGSQGERPIDTFFIHPTGFLTSGSWTSPMNPDSGTEENTQWMMANQASAYNGCCNIYSPRYREANIFVYFSADIKRRDAVLDFAYQDVKRAFAYFLKNVNVLVSRREYDLVYATSSRLMTAVLGAWIAARKKALLYLDIRDIFVDTINDVLDKKIALFTKPIFSLLEWWAINKANKVNLVSKGFRGYFESRYPHQNFSYFTNGIDDEFIEASLWCQKLAG